MLRSQAIRVSVESTLAKRAPSALSPRTFPVRERRSCGIDIIDDLLSGGLPLGAITELTGVPCSGRLTVACSYVAGMIRNEQVCAWIDVLDMLDPESAAANGIDLEHLLWVRCGVPPQPALPKPAPITLQPAASPTGSVGGTGSPHPRSEERGLGKAVDGLLRARTSPYKRDKSIGTPGRANRPITLPPAQPFKREAQPFKREVQVAFDRLPARRGDRVLEMRNSASAPASSQKAFSDPDPEAPPQTPGPARAPSKPAKPWNRLDQALRSTDLLLQTGGFGAIILDLGSLTPEFANRIPLATWFKFRAAADRTRTSLIVLAPAPCAGSSAELSLRFELLPPEPGTVMTGAACTAELLRQRFQPTNVTSIRKGPHRVTSAPWAAATTWATSR